MNFAVKTLSFALFFTVFLFSGTMYAEGCHNQNGCDTSSSALYNSMPYSNPTYSPSWTEVSTSGRVRGGQYLKFTVVEGEIYQWSTEGKEDVFGGSYASACTSEAACRTSSDITTQGLRCVGGYCLLPFDTELTLLKGESCSADAELLAYSNSGGFRNQSQIEWKADFTGTVVLLVTNYAYDASTASFVGCQKTSAVSDEGWDMTTTVKWHRASSEHCTTCDNEDGQNLYKFNFDPEDAGAAVFSSVNTAPAWTNIQTRDAVNLVDFELDTNSGNNWAKPGSYFIFHVVEDQLYRWSTCIADFQDTQLTLFKGDKTDQTDSCGNFLAYGDDSKVSYIYNDATYCPTGTKQTVLEWRANFTGEVTLLMNEYNCSQCYPNEIPLPGGQVKRDWLNCFVEVAGNFKLTAEGSGVFVKENGWPVKAGEGDPAAAAVFVYPFPLDWQRYDCTCEDSSMAASITDSSASFNDSVEVPEGKYVEFSLKRGAKYLFQAADPNAIITIRKGDPCSGTLLAQETGQVAYFADSSNIDMNTYTYSNDVINVLVSKADCRPGANTLIYKYYTTAGDIGNRYSVVSYSGKTVVTDNTTTVQFVDTGSWAKTWKEAIQTCQTTVVGEDSSSDILPCPKPVCPSTSSSGWGWGSTTSHYNDSNSQNTEYFCKYISTGANSDGTCKAPTCASNYAEYEKNSTNDPEYWGKCYYSGSTCDKTTQIVESPHHSYIRPWAGCNDGDEYVAVEAKCLGCDDGYNLQNIGSAIKQKWRCVKDECDETDAQKCVTIGGSCSYFAVDADCAEGYEYDPASGKCYDPDAGEIVNAEPGISEDPTLDPGSDAAITNASNDVSCPDGTTYSDGLCQIDNCGIWTYRNGTTSPYDGNNKYCLIDKEKCYKTEEEAAAGEGELVPCCCSSTIYVRGYTSDDNNVALLWDDGHKVHYKDSSGSCRNNELSCEEPGADPCPGGGQYFEASWGNQCAACSDPLILYSRNADNTSWGCRQNCEHYEEVWEGDLKREKCLTCEDGTQLVNEGGTWKCIACGDGRSPVLVGDSYKCVKSCETSDGSHIVKDGYCYPASSADDKCKEGWIEFQGKCRKLQTSTSGYVNVACGAGIDPKNNEPGRTCDPDNMNSYDCDCFEDRCEDQTRAADAKVCPNPYKVPYDCVVNHRPATCYYEYSTSTETVAYTLQDGTTVQVAKVCHYTDNTGQACGEAMGGWTLPNINQLYSIVDFDLYDPATAYPLKGAYIRNDSGATCSPVPSSNNDCTAETAAENCGVDEICINSKCVSTDPYGDMQCDLNGKYICVDNKCVRNNWYWSNTTVVSENVGDGQFTWAVNMEDGRSYRARKGCDGTDCAEEVDLNARPHHVLCIKGSSLAGIFDSDAPSSEQVFSGWACDTNDEPTSLTIYFEIVDSSSKDVTDLLGASEHIMTIPGLIHKGIKYGASDITPTEDPKMTEIYNNCGFPENPKPHAFEVKWKEDEFTAGKEDIAALIRKIADVECSDSRLADGGDAKSDCAVPPYFVTAYGVNEASSSVSAVAISPTNRPFVLKNRCGDGYKTYDGEYTENCESENFEGFCAYGNSECELCTTEDRNVSGTTYKACTFYPAQSPRCMDGTVNSYYCEDGVIADGHTGAGLECEYYNFAASNNISASEECDCSGGEGDMYLYVNGTLTCSSSSKLTAKVCPEYDTAMTLGKTPAESDYCYICSGCKKEKVARAYCGDGKLQRANCSGYANCEVVSGANEECDDGNGSDTDSCTTQCKLAKCGDGHIQASLDEICDSGAKNGYYETNCVGTEACPGCASITCGKPDAEDNSTDPLGPRCGDGIIQNTELCSDGSFLTTYGPMYGFSSEADCLEHLNGAVEKCDNGANNGLAITFADFLATSEGAGCSDTIGSDVYPVNAIHSKYLECVYKYKQYVDSHSGCSTDCKTPIAPYCGDGKVDPGEVCDDEIPTVTLVSGNYVMASSFESRRFNGKGYTYCRLDCKAIYKCDDDKIDTECSAAATEGFCSDIGTVDNGKVKLYVKDAKEYCDDGVLNGNYGYCSDGCLEKAYCGNGDGTEEKLDCIESGSGGQCLKKEECDFGSVGGNPNKSIDLAYSKARYGSCIAEDEACTGKASEWGDRICCRYGRYCGDGTVDNGAKVGDSVDWKTPANWNLDGATLTYDARSLALRFELTASEATAELSVPVDIDLNLRYLLEYNMMTPILSEGFAFRAGVNEYDASDVKIVNSSYANASPYFFADADFGSGAEAESWYRGKNAAPVKGESQGGSNQWYTGTKKVRIFFKMSGTPGAEFLVRALSFYTIENASYEGSGDSSTEKCDPGTANFKTESNYYMTDCNSECEWINYCGDSVVQRAGSCGSDGTYNGYPCVSNITYADEVCDNGSNGANVYNGCEPGCLELGPRCGDGFTDSKTCSSGTESWCHTPSGLDTAEQCDNGIANSNDSLGGDTYVLSLKNYGTCREDCTYSRCGDGILDEVKDADGNRVEECDCGAPGAYYEDTKNQFTTVNGNKVYICVADNGTELYNTVSAQRAALCRPNCRISRCGDGIKDAGEECDDGNFSDFDSCTSSCKLNRVGDGIYAHSRSYLCEELKSLSAAQMTKMAERGVVDCGGEGQISCSDLAAAITTDGAVKDYFEQNILHCCYNQKLGNGTDDKNCEIQLDGEYYSPKELAIDRCVKHAWLGNEYEADAAAKKSKCTQLEADGTYSAIELCEKCINSSCGRDCDEDDTKCKNQRTENCKHLPTQTEIDKCIENNTYCDSYGWNIIGRCGDGKTDSGAGEICDNNIAEEERNYKDLYNFSHAGGGGWSGTLDSGKWYNGHYCTGPCIEGGSCSEKSPMCGGSVTSDCWEKGCTRQAHRSGAADNETSMCGDGFLDTYAGEECDYGVAKHTESWNTSYCNPNCKYNRKGSASGPIAKCGDGEIQEKNEKCDDGDKNGSYCVNDCQLYYGTCGDGKITGPGYAFDSKWTPEGGINGPEDCDISDERTQSLISAGVQLSKLCNATTCKRVGSCGDGTRDPRFEGCDNGTGNNENNITKDGVTCFAGCKSNPKGGLIKATNSEISGWACDPDHPMTHPETLVRIEIYDSSSPAKEVGRKTLKTSKDVTGTDVLGFNATVQSVGQACGGGSSHGWTYDPSKSDASMNWEGKTAPFTVKAYATSLDGTPETEVFIGEKTFVRNMICGDAYKSTCSSIEVTTITKTPNVSWSAGRVCNDSEVEGGCASYGLENGAACEDNDERTCASITVTTITRTTGSWGSNRTCIDAEVENGCAYYGLENGAACVDEECDKGNANNGDDKDCDSKCQWTKCGDNTVQANATGIRPDGTSYEECEGTGKTECSGLLETEINTDQIKEEATCSGTSDPKCKWNKSTCTITSKCPALSTAITSWGGNYKADHTGDYIQAKNGTEYTRQWTGTGEKGWGTRETVVKYDTVASTAAEKACSYICTGKFTWDGSKCVPRTDVDISCNKCTDPHGIWIGTTSSCETTDQTIHQTVTINSDGSVTCVPGGVGGACGIAAVDPAHGDAASTSKCIWTCDNDSKWSSTENKCLANTKPFTCTGKPTGTHWMSVKLDASDNIVISDKGESMTVTQTLNPETLKYSPSDSALAALDINDGETSPKQLKNLLSKDGPVRCYFGCPSGTYYDGSTCKSSSCGDGTINSEHCENVTEGDCKYTLGKDEKCDDGSNNGKYKFPASDTDPVVTKSYCKSDCSGRIAGGTEYFCGDGVIQKKSTESCDSFLTSGTCKLVTESNYPGTTLDATEKCDGQTDHQTLCKLATGKNKTFYKYNSSSQAPSCKYDCSSINNGTSTTGCNYCGDGVIGGSETCEPSESSATICSRETGSYYGQTQTYIWNFESSSWPTSWLTASVSSWGLNSTYKYSGSYSYCSTNAGSESSSATMTLNVTAKAAGNVTFYIYGTSEKSYDYLTIYQGGSQVWTSKGTDYDSWTQLSFPVSAGTTAFQFTYSKDSSVDTGLDRYCVDYLSAPSVFVPYTSRTTSPSTKTCNSDCTLGSGTCYSGWCGDGTTQSAYEVCDSGSSNSNSWASSASSKHCNSNCTGWAPYCGDGVVNGSEPCEIGQTKTVTGDKCDSKTSWGSTTYYYYKTGYTCNSSCQWYVSTPTYCDN